MGLRVVGTYEIDVVGDGVSTENLFMLRGLKPPAPLADHAFPTGILGASVSGSNTVTATMEGEFVHLNFKTAPSPTSPITVTLTMLFGVDRL